MRAERVDSEPTRMKRAGGARPRLSLAVVGGGWAGLAAAVRATEAGHAVTLFEMAGALGGRAREVKVHGMALDNGQHILIGAYQRTLALMHTVGTDIAASFDRRPLELRYPDGRGLRLPRGPAWLGFGWAVWRCQGWILRDRLALVRAAAGWALKGFHCAPGLTVHALCADLPPAVRVGATRARVVSPLTARVIVSMRRRGSPHTPHTPPISPFYTPHIVPRMEPCWPSYKHREIKRISEVHMTGIPSAPS